MLLESEFRPRVEDKDQSALARLAMAVAAFAAFSSRRRPFFDSVDVLFRLRSCAVLQNVSFIACQHAINSLLYKKA